MADPMQFQGTDPTDEILAYYSVTTDKHLKFDVPLSLERAGTLGAIYNYEQTVSKGQAVSGNALANSKNILTDLDGDKVGKFEPDHSADDDQIKFHIGKETDKP